MRVLVLTALLSALAAAWVATAAQADPCARENSRNCFNVPATINFSSVPEISNQIVGTERLKQNFQITPPRDEPAATPYTGPMIGTSSRPGRTPTVGYYWSLDE
jgi:hypothetical protein